MKKFKKATLVFLEVFLLCFSLSGGRIAPDVVFAQAQSYEMLISDSLYLYSPSVLDFNIQVFLDMQSGPLKSYEEQINDDVWTAAEAIRFNAIFYGVNPQFILTLLEAHNHLITDNNAEIPLSSGEEPVNSHPRGFYYYVRWLTGSTLQAYEQRRGHTSDNEVTFSSGETLTVPTELNAGTYAAQVGLAKVLTYEEWENWVVGSTPLFVELFSDWFDVPHLDKDRAPTGATALPGGYILPFTIGETWYYTGGPHNYIGVSACSNNVCARPWSSIDIAPPESISCPSTDYPSNRWLVAAKAGTVIESSQALVVIDHGDGWRTYYSHVATTDRHGTGSIGQGEHVGHPSCEVEPGGSTSGVHVHFAIWQAGVGFVDIASSSLSGWLIQETTHYNGTMTRNGVTRTADTSKINGYNDILNSGSGCCGCASYAKRSNSGIAAACATSSVAPVDVQSTWGTKPLLGYFVLNPQLSQKLRDDLNLTNEQYTLLREIAIRESEQLRDLHGESEEIIQDSGLSLNEKRSLIMDSQYNQRVLDTIQVSQQDLVKSLGETTYRDLVTWIEQAWLLEIQTHSYLNAPTASRSYTVFATQYAANTNYEISLPDKCLKFANRGWSLASCPSGEYAQGQNYSVRLVRDTYTIDSVQIGDVGPWNEDDNYWATTTDPQHRRLFTDLPLGIPEAQAAFIDGYNGGKDQFGRLVGNPAGIDLSDGVRQDLGLGYLENAWITVTYLWTAGWNTSGCCGCGTLMNCNNISTTLQISSTDSEMEVGTSQALTQTTIEPAVQGYPASFGLNRESTNITLTAQIEPQVEAWGTDEVFVNELEEVEVSLTKRALVLEIRDTPKLVKLAHPASDNYYLARSVMAMGGGAKTSAMYQVLGTSGQTNGVSRLTSSSYRVNSGFWNDRMFMSGPSNIYLPLVLRLR